MIAKAGHPIAAHLLVEMKDVYLILSYHFSHLIYDIESSLSQRMSQT